MLSKLSIVSRLIKLVAAHLRDHCRNSSTCSDCIYLRKTGCVFEDLPLLWDVDDLDDGSEN